MPSVLTPCLCGADDLHIGGDEHRRAARESSQQHLKDVSADDMREPQVQRDFNRSQLAHQVLQAESMEVSCGNCGRWVHADSEVNAINTWNKALERLATLQACCQTDYERRVDYDGMVLHVCTSPAHDETIHGRRHHPLEPSADYDVKPSQAGRRPS